MEIYSKVYFILFTCFSKFTTGWNRARAQAIGYGSLKAKFSINSFSLAAILYYIIPQAYFKLDWTSETNRKLRIKNIER